MQYSEKQKAEFKAKFIQTRRYQIALFVPVGGAAFLLVFSQRFVAQLGLQPILLGTVFLVLVAAGFSWLNWRCPACRKHLGKGLSPNRCPNCGAVLMPQ